MKKYIVYVISFTAVVGYAQGPDTLWTKTYGGDSTDIGYAVQQTFDSGFIIVGETRSYGAGEGDVYLIKTDSLGDTLWTKTYGGAADDKGYSVQQTADSGYIIVGETRSFGADQSDIYLIKTDALGDTLWTRTHGGQFDDGGYSVLQWFSYYDNGYIISGYIGFDAHGHESDVCLIKTNSEGYALWLRTYGLGEAIGAGYAVQQCTDTGYVIAGYAHTPRLGGRAYLIRTDYEGNHLWHAGYVAYSNRIPAGHFNSVQVTTEGGYVAVGGPYVYLVKTDSMGNSLWEKRYGEPDDDYEDGRSVQQTIDGGYIITGLTNYGAEWDVWLLKANENGDTLWTKTYGSNGPTDEGYSVQQTSDGGYVVAGVKQSFGAGNKDIWLIKTEPDTLGVVEQRTLSLENDYMAPTIFTGPLLLPEDKECRVLDITGRVVAPDKIRPGIYFIEVEGKITQKVVKIR